MLELAIIADDLTGAADTGVQFCPYFLEPVLMSYNNLSSDPEGMLHSSLQALAVYTNSRSLNAVQAQKRLQTVSRQLLLLQPKHIYKKVDSCIRGNLGPEVEAIMDETGYEVSFIAPAFPEMGRTTCHDVHLVDGVPVALTELSQDPVTPVTESRLSRVVSTGGRYKIACIDLCLLDRTDHALNAEIDRLIFSGARHLIFDATQQKHLDTIARLAVSSPRKILLVGSAGLAGSFSRNFPKQRTPAERVAAISKEGNYLLVCGTASKRTHDQIERVLKTYSYGTITLAPNLLADKSKRESLLLEVPRACSMLGKDNLIVRIAAPEFSVGGDDTPSGPWTGKQIVRGLGFFVSSVLRETRPASVFLTGGDTANAVLKAIDAKGIRLGGEIVSGMAYGMLMGGSIDRLPITTKAGAFGKRDTLVALHEYWENQRLPDKYRTNRD
jgi:uncharacterized protein YgbK (DUF1537 family)